MGVVQVNHGGECIEDACAEHLLSSESPDICNIFGDPDVLPRVGDEYQVEIPPLITESDYLCLTNCSTDAKSLANVPHDFLIGLPISIIWISIDIDNTKHEPLETVGNSADISNEHESVNSESINKTQMLLEGADLKPKVEPMGITLHSRIIMAQAVGLALQQEMKIEMHQKHRGKVYCPVPGSLGDSWSDIDEATFLLGLYIFGKNLTLVKKFVESKKMGDILSFYYGKFYRSEKYRRWSECRKARSRRCIYGQRIFTGLRQHEFLSRLLCHVSEQCQSTLLEISKTFGEGKMLLDDYVFTLKAAVGLNALVEAVGIGKGKEDLTGMAAEPTKSNQVVPVRPEIPIGKACSTLTPLEIVNFLTGDYRLSKARSNDLFWEAVWPRLLARGWHSEQANNYSFAAGYKHSLVFLIPGVKKFSRRKIVKGNHYFDSVSDVLSKVASDPGLLELEIGADKGDNIKEENGWTDETKLDQESFPDKQRHCYLKPRTPNHATDAMKFTIVDTSLVNKETSGVREIRTLPVEMNAPTSRSRSEDSDDDTSEESTDESDSADTLSFDSDKIHALKPTKINFDKGDSSDRNASNQMFAINGPDSKNATMDILKEKNSNTWSDIQPRKGLKDQPSHRMKSDDKNHLAPVTKRRRKLTACSRTETLHSTINTLLAHRIEKQEEASCSSGNLDLSVSILSEVDAPEEKLSSASTFSKGSLVNSGEGIRISTCADHPYEEHQPRTLIDLNLPVPPDAETDGLFIMEITEIQHDQTSKQPENPGMLKSSHDVPSFGLQLNMNGRRQSTRNRPLTTKALEALACGFLTIKQKRKCRDDFPREPRPSRHARGRATVAENFDEGIVDFKAEERVNGVHDGNGDMLNKLPV